MDDNTINSNKVVKGCDCLPKLRDKFRGLFHRNTPVDALPLPEDMSPVGDESDNKSIVGSSMTSVVAASNVTSNCSNNLLCPDDEFHLDNESIAASDAKFLLLPDDVIINILSRLTFTFKRGVQCRRVCRSLRQLTSTPDYNSMLLTQTASVIAIQSRSLCREIFDKENILRAYRLILHFVNQDNDIVVLKTTFNINYMPQEFTKPSLIGSYHGLLWFSHKYQKGLIILNPVTKEQVIVKAPSGYYFPCGLYFHVSTGEYRVLYVRTEKGGENRFYVLNLRSKLLREIGKCAVAPCTCASPTILNGALYWMASVGCYLCSIRETPPCSEFILVFSTDKEAVTTMPHPRVYHSEITHRMMKLLEKDGKLCLLDILPSTFKLYLWVLLEDYRQEKFWVVQHIIDLKQAGISYLPSNHAHSRPRLTALDIRNGEILFKSGSLNILLTFKKVDRKEFGKIDFSHAVLHKPTFATLKCDTVISLV